MEGRLIMFYKILYLDSIAIRIPPYYSPSAYLTRQFHLLHFVIPSATILYYQKSFFLRTIVEWNNLSVNIIESDSLDKFSNSLN